MTYPVAENPVVTDDYHGHKSGRLTHRAWDIAAPIYSHIVAPEDGRLVLWYMVRAGSPLPSTSEALQLPADKIARCLSWYFADRYGAMVGLLAEERWWLFCHVPPPAVFSAATLRSCPMLGVKWRDDNDVARFIELYSNTGPGAGPGMDRLPSVSEGDVIAVVGDSGYSTGPHCHMEITRPYYDGGAPARVDPAGLFVGGRFA